MKGASYAAACSDAPSPVSRPRLRVGTPEGLIVHLPDPGAGEKGVKVELKPSEPGD